MSTLDPDSLTSLCAVNPMEAQVLRASLEAAGLAVILQGEHASAIDPRIGFIEGVRILVRQGDLETARALMGGVETADPEGRGGLTGVCAVHERAARGTCASCAGLLCDACKAQGTPPICNECRADAASPSSTGTGQGLLSRGLVLLLLLPLAVAILAALVAVLRGSLAAG